MCIKFFNLNNTKNLNNLNNLNNEKIENFINLKYLIFPNDDTLKLNNINKNFQKQNINNNNNKLFYKKRILNKFLINKNKEFMKHNTTIKNYGRWTKNEKDLFLKGKKEFGHNWSKISKFYVITRNRIQVASHYQSLKKKKNILSQVFNKDDFKK